MAGTVNVFTATATDNTGPAFNSVQNNIKKTKRESEKLNGSLRMMRGGFGQLGHQVQDVAVQLQMGQNPLMVLTQQGSQVASLFGPQGAIIGAVGAVAGALASVLVPKLFASSGATEELHEKVKNLASLMKKDGKTGAIEYAGALAKVAAASASAGENLRLAAIEVAQERMVELQQELSNTVDSFDDVMIVGTGLNAQLTEAHEVLGLQREDYDKLNKSVNTFDMTTHSGREAVMGLLVQLRASQAATGAVDEDFKGLVNRFSDAHVELSTLQQGLKDFSQIGAPGVETATDDMASSFDRFISSLTRSVQKAEGLTPAQMLGIQLQNMEGLTQAETDLAVGLINRLRQQEIATQKTKDAIQADKDAAKAAKELARTQKAFADADVAALGGGFGQAVADAAIAARKKTEQKLENMRIGFLSELELIGEQEQQKKDFITGLDETFFDAAFTRQDALTLIEKDAAAKRIKIAEDEEDQKRKIQQMGMAVITDSLNFMANNLKEGTALQKAAFLASKAFAASEAIIAANRAAALVLPNVGLSKLILGMGYANAAMIMGQAVASFEGGGFTGRGARSGGMDGNGGFLAMLHPNEKVTDLHNGGGSGVTIVNNIDARGADSSVDIKIRKAVQESSAATIETIRDLSKRRRFI